MRYVSQLALTLTQYVVVSGLAAGPGAASRSRALAAVVDVHILSPCCAVSGSGTGAACADQDVCNESHSTAVASWPAAGDCAWQQVPFEFKT